MKRFRVVVLFLLLLSLAALACNFGSADPTPTPFATEAPAGPTEAPEPTATPLPPTEVAPTEAAAPTKEPAATDPPPTAVPPAGDAEAAFALAPSPYAHPGGFFTLTPPQDWAVDEGTAFASFTDPVGEGFIYVQVTNTGLDLDDTAFERFVTAREKNFFEDFDGYTTSEVDVDTETDVATATKEVVFEGVPQVVITVYDKYGPIIYSYDFWAEKDQFDAYSAGYGEVIDTVTVNTDAATDLDNYIWVYTFTGPNDLFTIEVPTPWTYEATEGDSAIVETFYAPDDHAVIQNVAFDDGTEVSRSDAGAFALELLRSYYADDIRILDDQVQPDGSERLIWNSASGEYSGISFFETRGTTFLLFSVLYDDAYEDVYFDVLDYTIGTYDVP